MTKSQGHLKHPFRLPFIFPLAAAIMAAGPLAYATKPQSPQFQLCDPALQNKEPVEAAGAKSQMSQMRLPKRIDVETAIAVHKIESAKVELAILKVRSELFGKSGFSWLNANKKLMELEARREQVRKDHVAILENVNAILSSYGFKSKVIARPSPIPNSALGFMAELLRLWEAKESTSITNELAKLLAKRKTLATQSGNADYTRHVQLELEQALADYPELSDAHKTETQYQQAKEAWESFQSNNKDNPNFQKAKDQFPTGLAQFRGLLTLKSSLEGFSKPHIEILEFPDSMTSKPGNISRLASTVRKKFNSVFTTNINEAKSDSVHGSHTGLSNLDTSRIWMSIQNLLNYSENRPGLLRTAIHEALHASYGFQRSMGKVTDLDLALKRGDANSAPILRGYRDYISFEEADTWTQKAVLQSADHKVLNSAKTDNISNYNEYEIQAQLMFNVMLESIQSARNEIIHQKQNYNFDPMISSSLNSSFAVELPIFVKGQFRKMIFLLNGEKPASRKFAKPGRTSKAEEKRIETEKQEVINKMFAALDRAEKKIKQLQQDLNKRTDRVFLDW
ncbi:MAG TPA: hypothetical protein PLU50_01425 [Pseudobdellovibrionaceae bacterium]|nr:hypothetical protein [Pseudobdellovibrionaceae bacterium]